ncbi:MAG: hypothetical protein AB7I30_15645 [Isosphaeraceae bacterium]
MKGKTSFSARVETLEGRTLLSVVATSPTRNVAHDVSLRSTKLSTRVGQFGTAAAVPGATAQVTVLLGVVGRTGAVSPLHGTVKVYQGSTLVGSVNVNQMHVGSGVDVYGKGVFHFIVPRGSAKGSSITLTLRYEGAQLYNPSQGTARVSVR